MEPKLLDSLAKARQIIIAYSGGLDSTVLLHRLSQQPHLVEKCLAIYIHHGLQPQADAWQQHCEQICQKFSIAFQMVKVKIDCNKRDSLEALARQARYDALTPFVTPNTILVTAHHQDDQAETLLLQLLRGAGVKGLAAMPQHSSFAEGILLRPLLQECRADLVAYAQRHGLQWIEDESNADRRFDRNYLRHEIIPRLQQRWPHALTTIARSAQHCAVADHLLQELASQDQIQAAEIPCHPFVLRYFAYQPLSIELLKNLSPPRQANVLRQWLHTLHLDLPSQTTLLNIIEELMMAKTAAQPLVQWGTVEVRRFQNYLYVMSALPAFDSTAVIPWDGQAAIATAIGIITDIKLPMHLSSPTYLTIRYRQGGERFHPQARQKSQCLKKLMQEWQIPPWLRNRWPLLYQGDTLVSVLGIADGKSRDD